MGFLLIGASFKCYFWIPHLKTRPDTHFHENITSQTQVINVNASLRYSKTAYFRKNEGILAKICTIHISVTIPVTRLKFGSFPYLYSMNLYAKFQGFLKTWVSGPYYLSLFNVEFPFMKALKAFIKPFETPQISEKKIIFSIRPGLGREGLILCHDITPKTSQVSLPTFKYFLANMIIVWWQNSFELIHKNMNKSVAFGRKYSRMDQVKCFKGCLPQISLSPFLNIFSHLHFHLDDNRKV